MTEKVSSTKSKPFLDEELRCPVCGSYFSEDIKERILEAYRRGFIDGRRI